MVRKKLFLLAGLLLTGLFIAMACGGSGGVDPPPNGVSKYAGSAACKSCHESIFNTFMYTGHPFKLNEVKNGVAPKFPYTSVPQPPAGYTWSDIEYVIGGFKWKARFVGKDGYIITGDPGASTQYNIDSRKWVPYHAGEQKAYDCGSCHNTGYQSAGHQDNLAGITGTWALDGVQCEACHGEGKDHVDNPTSSNINFGGDPKETCSNCHVRDSINTIDASGGFIRHHEQSEELLASMHGDELECTSCHDPHTSVLYEDSGHNPNDGLVAQCEDCHDVQAEFQGSTVMKASGVSCKDCHMPPMVKSAIGDLDTFTADISSHIFKINTDPDVPQFSPDGTSSMKYITIQYACQHCHIEGGTATPYSVEALAARAESYHYPEGADRRVGKDRCAGCHMGISDEVGEHGHSFALNKIIDGNPPEHPFTDISVPPSGYTWDDILYTIGGYGWKALFVGNDGYIITGDTGDRTQFNLATLNYVEYHAGELRQFDCGACHTTGYDFSGNQDEIAGLKGTWEEEGVVCENCHGPAGAHVEYPSPDTINMKMDPKNACGLCHTGGNSYVVEVDDGLVLNNQQHDEMMLSPHSFLGCTGCHSPHAGTKHNDQADGEGLIRECTNCHSAESHQVHGAMSALDCIDCHMPRAAKSAVISGEGIHQIGDVRNHIWKIDKLGIPIDEFFSTDGASTWITADFEGKIKLNLAWTCMSCHDGFQASKIESYTLLANRADGIHDN